MEDLKLIEGSDTDYVSKCGKIYQVKNGVLRQKKKFLANTGYEYIGVLLSGGRVKTFRVHRLVASAFLTPVDGKPIVGHKNNIKNDNRVENLYWTDVSENTKKAFDDGLAVNAKGIHDSQSIPIAVYDSNKNLISVYGSVKEAGRKIKGFPASSIYKALTGKVGRKGYIFEKITKEFYESQPTCFVGVEFETKKMERTRSMIEVKDLQTKKEFVCNTQKEVERLTGISQPKVSAILNGKEVSSRYILKRIVL